MRHPSSFHRPIVCSERRDLGGQPETDTQWGSRGVPGESGGHSLITWMQSDTQCAYVSVRTGSVIGHQMVTVWAGPQQAKKKKGGGGGVRGVAVSSLPLLSLTHTQKTRTLRCMQWTVRVMGDNGADPNKSAPPGSGPGPGLRKQTVCPNHKPKYNTAAHTRQTGGPVTLTVKHSVSRAPHLLFNYIYTSGIHCGLAWRCVSHCSALQESGEF